MDDKFVISATTEGFSVLVYGDPGVGKTLFAGSGHASPALAPILYFNSDHGVNTVAHINTEYLIEDREPPLRQFPVDDADDLNYAVLELLKPDGTRDDPFNGIKTVVFDSVTAFRDSAMRSEAEQQASKPNARRTNPDQNELQDYNLVLNMLMRNLYRLRQTGLNIVFIAGEAPNPQTGRIGADLNPKMAQFLNRFVSYYWRIIVGSNGKRAIQVVDKGQTPAIVKTRGVPYSRALSEITTDKGNYVIEDDTFPTFQFLHDLYIKTTLGDMSND